MVCNNEAEQDKVLNSFDTISVLVFTTCNKNNRLSEILKYLDQYLKSELMRIHKKNMQTRISEILIICKKFIFYKFLDIQHEFNTRTYDIYAHL